MIFYSFFHTSSASIHYYSCLSLTADGDHIHIFLFFFKLTIFVLLILNIKGVGNGKIDVFKELTPHSRTYELRGQG